MQLIKHSTLLTKAVILAIPIWKWSVTNLKLRATRNCNSQPQETVTKFHFFSQRFEHNMIFFLTKSGFKIFTFRSAGHGTRRLLLWHTIFTKTVTHLRFKSARITPNKCKIKLLDTINRTKHGYDSSQDTVEVYTDDIYASAWLIEK